MKITELVLRTVLGFLILPLAIVGAVAALIYLGLSGGWQVTYEWLDRSTK